MLTIDKLATRYDSGAASVAVGGTVVTPKDAAWLGNAWGDDLFFLPSQPLIPAQRIDGVNEDGSLTLAYPWPGVDAVEEPYEIRYVGIIERSTAQSRKVLEQLGDVKAWYDVVVEDDAARLALETPTSPLRAGYRVMVKDPGVIWAKKTAAYGDWIGPVEFRGEKGDKGDTGDQGPTGRGPTPKGTYNPATAYVLDDAVLDNGSSWIALGPTTGNAPPVLPTISNAYWQLLARQGIDGAGTVSSVVAGAGVSVDNTDPTAPVISANLVPPNTATALNGRVGDINVIANAVRSGAAKVAFWGDSILEGTSQITYGDSAAGLIQKHLVETVGGVAWTFENYSIAGYAMTNAASAVFDGTHVVGSTLNPPVHELWPDGDTPTKAWRDWVKDAAPDLLFIAFGMNAESDPNDFATALESVIDYAETWAKVPSIVVITPPLPTKAVSAASPWEDVQGCADAARGVAQKRNVSLVDANALYRVHLDGVDILRTRSRFTIGFEEYGDWTLLSGAAPALVSDTLEFSAAGRVQSAEETQNIDLSVQLDLTTATLVDVFYRSEQPTPDDSYVLRVASGGAVTWFNKVTPIYSTSVAASSTYRVTIKAIGARHEIWVNDTKLDLPDSGYDFGYVKAGKYGLAVTGGAATASNFYGRAGAAPVLSGPLYTEAELLGVNDWLTNPDSIGGSGVNHPSSICCLLDYFAGAKLILDAISESQQRERVGFDARWATAVSATNKITGYTEAADAGGDFDPVTGRFVAPVPGIYVFSFNFLASSGVSASVHLYKNNAQGGWGASTALSTSASGVYVLPLVKGDYVELFVTAGAPEVDERYNHFSGVLLN